MKIKATENHRLGTSVNVLFELDGAEPYNRYVDAVIWDEDPDAIIASIYNYLTTIPSAPFASAAIKTEPIEMTEDEVLIKLVAIEDAKKVLNVLPIITDQKTTQGDNLEQEK